MPELPDVEIFKQYLESTSLKKKIKAVEKQDRKVLEGVSPSRIKKTLEDESLVSARRHGKYLFVETTSAQWLVIHFGMTGFLKYFKDPSKKPMHTRFLVRFSRGFHLAYDCQRKLGRISLTDDPGTFIQKKELGPDALDPNFHVGRFMAILRESRAQVKSVLMNQKHMAGIGNIYSDEILFQAGIRPQTKSTKLDEDEIEELYSQKDRVLKKSIEARADPDRLPPSFIIPHRHSDGSCPKCKDGIIKVTIAGRSAYYCPGCQK